MSEKLKGNYRLMISKGPDHIDTGFIFTCPICKKKYHIIHTISNIKKKINHKFEEVIE